MLTLSLRSGVGELRIFVRFIHDPRGPGWTEVIRDADRIGFERLSVEAVAALCGAKAEEVWTGDDSCAGLAGHSHPLLALLREPEIERNPLDEMAVIAVADLPWAHNPSRCAHADRFQVIESVYPASGFAVPAVGAQWFLTLSESFRGCPYHQVDWLRIAAASVDLLQQKEDGATIESVLEAVADVFGHTPEHELCVSLFTDPIVWQPEQTSVTNGQHRTCALKAAGAPLCVVDIDGGYLGQPIVGDPHRRASAEIAQFWARRAAA